LAALPGGVLVPSPTLRVTSRDAATCSLAINAISCTTTDPSLAARPVGMTVTTSAAVLAVGASGGSNAVATDLLLNELTIAGASGCAGTLTAACVDAVGQSASTAGQVNPTVALPAWRANWNTTSIPNPFVVVPGNLPDFTVVFALLDDGRGAPVTFTMLSCLALLLPATVTPPPLNKSLDLVLPRDVLSSDTAVIGALNSTAAVVAFAGLTASAALLGQALALYAECTWTATGERVRLPPLTLSTLQLALDWVAPPSTVLSYTAVPLQLVVRTMAPATTGGTAMVAAAECEVLLVNATSRSARLGSADPWALTIDGGAPAGSVVATVTNVTIEAPQAVVAVIRVSCIVWGKTLLSPPLHLTTANLTLRMASVRPTSFIASDAPSSWPVEPQLDVTVAVTDTTGASIMNATDATCTLTTTTTAVELKVVGSSTSSALQSIAAHPSNGAVVVPRFYVQTATTTPTVELVLDCRRTTSGDALPPLAFTILAVQLVVEPCTQPARDSFVGTALPPFAVGIVATPPGGLPTMPCAATTYSPPFTLPAIVCTIALNASATTNNDTANIFLQNTLATMSAASHRAVFDAFTVVAQQGETYGLTIICAVGGLAIQPILSFSVTLAGCSIGKESQGVACVTCGGTTFSLGGIGARCTACPPAGAVCDNGIITLLPHYFRPASQAGQPLGPDTELHPCYNAEACTLTYNNDSSTPTYGCAYGNTGPLCGVCDAAVNYAQFGEACALCWEAGASWLFLIVLVTLVLAALTRVALRKESGRSDESIVLRITLGYLQAVGSLRVFRTGSTKAYDNVIGWTEVVSASPLSVGALQCILRLPYLFQYVATILLPVLASAAVVAIFLGVTASRSVHCKPRCNVDRPAFKAAVATWRASKRHLSTLLFVLFLTYMPIVSASLHALDCIEPVAGVRYLRSDLRVECGVGQHAAARALAYIVLIVLGIGFPAGLAWLLGTARNEQLVDPAFHATWGFLFDGYRAPTRSLATSPLLAVGDASNKPGSPGKLFGAPAKPTAVVPPPVGSSTPAAGGTSAAVRAGRRRSSLLPERLTQTWVVSGDSRVWWEAVVLCRKAGVVLLAVTLTNPYLQCVGASLWFFAAYVLQVRYSPYTKPLFNRLETASLVTTLLTAIISTALLQYNVGVTSAELHPPDAMTGIEWAVTILLALMNVGTFAAFAILWLRLQCVRAHGIVRRASVVTALSGRVAGMRASFARRRSSAAMSTKAPPTTPAKLLHTIADGNAALPTATENPLHVRAAPVVASDAAPGVVTPVAVLAARSHMPRSRVDDAAAAIYPDTPSAAASRRHVIGITTPPPPVPLPRRPGCADDDAKHAAVQPSAAAADTTRTAADDSTTPTPAAGLSHERGVAFAATPVFRTRRRV